MNFAQLMDFVENKMRMSADYQPRIIKLLVTFYPHKFSVDNTRVCAHLFPDMPFSQSYKRVRNMPYKILKKHGVIDFDKETVALTCTESLTKDQRKSIIKLCDRKISEWKKRKLV